MNKQKIKNHIRTIIFKLFRYSGITVLIRELIQKNKVTILLFHDISFDTAEQTFKYLTKKYNIISLDDFVNYRMGKTNQIPPKALIITFDDGFTGNYNLLPIFKKYNLPVTIFLCASVINTNRHFWFKKNKSNFSLSELKQMPNNRKLEILAQTGFHTEKEYDNAIVLSKSQITKMNDFVDFQSHTKFHPCLPKCTNSEAKEEIAGSKQILENEFDLIINAIAYPNGDYSDRDIKYAKNAGYNCGLTVDFGYNSKNTDLFKLKRICVNDTTDMNELIVKASGFWEFIKTINGKNQDHGWTNNVQNK
jgi:peptidoglycan/xylan/chitin deacetylase (PgdA/CDA1 family)